MTKLIQKLLILSLFFVVYEDTQYRTVPCADWIKQEQASTKEKTVYITAACMEKVEITYKAGPYRSKKQAEQAQLPFLKSKVEEVK